MSDWALYLGLAALLCAACSLLGAGFAWKWGVDPSRETPGAGKKGAGRRLLFGCELGFLVMLPPALWMSAVTGQMLGERMGAAVCAGFALLCAMLGFCAAFTALRHGAKSLAHVCEEEFFSHAGKLRLAIGALACVFSAGTMLMAILRDGEADVTNAMLLVFSCALWPMLSMRADRLTGLIQNERKLLSCAAGGPVCAALIAILALLPGAKMLLSVPVIAALMVSVRVLWLAAWLALCCLGGRALHDLLERPFQMKKRSVLPKRILCIILSVPLALYAPGWLFLVSAALCGACVLMDVAACSVWLRRIGRGFFSRY